MSKNIFSLTPFLVITIYMFDQNHFKNENSSADVAKLIRYTFGYVSPFEDLIIRLLEMGNAEMHGETQKKSREERALE